MIYKNKKFLLTLFNKEEENDLKHFCFKHTGKELFIKDDVKPNSYYKHIEIDINLIDAKIIKLIGSIYYLGNRKFGSNIKEFMS